MISRSDDLREPITPHGAMRSQLVEGRLVVTNPWQMHLWLEPGGAVGVIPGHGTARETVSETVHFTPPDGFLHGLIREVDDPLACRLGDDPSIGATLRGLEVHGVARPRRDGGILGAAGLVALLRIPCPLKIRLPHGGAIGAAGFAGLPQRTDVVIEGLVPDWMHADCLAALPSNWKDRVRLVPIASSWSRARASTLNGGDHADASAGDLDEILHRIDEVLGTPLQGHAPRSG